jgi:hypothetical protein
MLPPLLSTVQNVAQAESPISLIDFKTALLVVVTVALFAVSRKLIGLHRRIEVLETGSPFPSANSSKTITNNQAVAPETVAAISAAVHTTLRSRLRILSVGQVSPDRQAWSAEGRRQVFASHKVR